MSVSYGIIQEHGGKITVKSEIGRKTTFTIVLRALDSADVDVEDESLSPPVSFLEDGQGKHVLVIDDEEVIQEMLTDVFTSANYSVDVVGGGEQALQNVETTLYDIILCDWKMAWHEWEAGL